MIKRLLLGKQSYTQLIIVLFGTLFGMLLTMTSIQLYADFKNVLDSRKELISSRFLVINKSISLVNTISGSHAVFSDEEIASFNALKSIEKVGVFRSNRFRAQTGIQLEDKEMFTDMFFESVPDAFLDVHVPEWNWKPGMPVPIILPADYLNLYNFGFAPSQGLPQISKGAAKLAGLRVVISGRGKTENFNGMIAGFTDRINSILVPESFLDYANEHCGEAPENGVSRLVLLCKDPGDPNLLKLIEDRGYETNLEILKSGKMHTILNMGLTIVLFVGAIIILLAVLGFIQYAQLLIVNSTYEIKTLLHLGYKIQSIWMHFMAFYAVLMGGILILSFIAAIKIKAVIAEFMIKNNFEPLSGLSLETYLSAFALALMYLFVNGWSTLRRIKRLGKPN